MIMNLNFVFDWLKSTRVSKFRPLDFCLTEWVQSHEPKAHVGGGGGTIDPGEAGADHQAANVHTHVCGWVGRRMWIRIGTNASHSRV
jgi:hypothetical protein